MLPRVNDKPKYEAVVPSTGKTVSFRPYLVKEEKVLMIAMEAQDQSQALHAIADTIVACTNGEVNKEDLTIFDVEYLFTTIRSKSVGEVARIGMRCDECEAENEVNVDLRNLPVPSPREDTQYTIAINDTISVDLDWPKYHHMIEVDMAEETQSRTAQTFSLLSRALVSVNTEEESIAVKDESEEEIHAFIESLDNKQFTAIADFLESMPRVSMDVEYTCSSCGHHHKIKMEGISDFF